MRMRSAIEYYLGMTFLRTKGGSSQRWRVSEDFNFTKLGYISPSLGVCVCVCIQLLSCVQLCKPMNCSPLGSSVHGILPARILECGLPCPPPGDLPDPGIKPTSPALQADSLLLSYRENPVWLLTHIPSLITFSFYSFILTHI